MTRKCFAMLFLLATASVAFADGGRLRFRQPAGPFIVSLFTTPDPLTAGRADFSVAVERRGLEGLLQDANITFMLIPADGQKPLLLHASHAAATSRFLQAANFTLPHPGAWQVKVLVRRGDETGECVGEVTVFPADMATRQLTWDVAAVPLFLLLFILHQRRKQSHNKARKREQAKRFYVRMH